MSLDVYLTIKGLQNPPNKSCIFIRENGEIKEINREEWDKRYPGREPHTVELGNDDEEVYSANITHNLAGMTSDAGIYRHLSDLLNNKAVEILKEIKDKTGYLGHVEDDDGNIFLDYHA